MHYIYLCITAIIIPALFIAYYYKNKKKCQYLIFNSKNITDENIYKTNKNIDNVHTQLLNAILQYDCIYKKYAFGHYNVKGLSGIILVEFDIKLCVTIDSNTMLVFKSLTNNKNEYQELILQIIHFMPCFCLQTKKRKHPVEISSEYDYYQIAQDTDSALNYVKSGFYDRFQYGVKFASAYAKDHGIQLSSFTHLLEEIVDCMDTYATEQKYLVMTIACLANVCERNEKIPEKIQNKILQLLKHHLDIFSRREILRACYGLVFHDYDFSKKINIQLIYYFADCDDYVSADYACKIMHLMSE